MIDNIHIENFFGFKEFDYTDISPLTLVIGKNDSGKTGLLKLLYATSRSLVEILRSQQQITLKSKIGEKLNTTFFPRKGGLGSLVTKGSEDGLSVSIGFKGKESLDVTFGFSSSANKEPGNCSHRIVEFAEDFNAIFLPAKEVLTVFNSIAFTRENYDFLDFDDTYYDIVKSLRIPTSKGRVSEIYSKVSKELEEMFEGKIEQTLDDKLNPFIFKKGNTQFTMPLTAEGIKKIGVLTTLINNRQLGKNTLLFLDEPETALHPDAQRRFAEMLFQISNIEGVKVFLATHSYFMVNQFANIARREQQSIKCISIEKKNTQTNVQYAIHDMKNGLPENSIIHEAQEMFREDTKIEFGL